MALRRSGFLGLLAAVPFVGGFFRRYVANDMPLENVVKKVGLHRYEISNRADMTTFVPLSDGTYRTINHPTIYKDKDGHWPNATQ